MLALPCLDSGPSPLDFNDKLILFNLLNSTGDFALKTISRHPASMLVELMAQLLFPGLYCIARISSRTILTNCPRPFFLSLSLHFRSMTHTARVSALVSQRWSPSQYEVGQVGGCIRIPHHPILAGMAVLCRTLAAYLPTYLNHSPCHAILHRVCSHVLSRYIKHASLYVFIRTCE